MHLPTDRWPGPAWAASRFPAALGPAHGRLRARILARVTPEGSIEDPCRSRALESGLALKLIDRTGLSLERRPALVAFLESCGASEDPTERAIAHHALHGGPKPGDRDVARFLAEAPEFTGSRKRVFLDALLAVFGTAPTGAAPPVAGSLSGLHVWAAVQVTAARVILADAMGRYDLISDADVRLLLDTQHPIHVWEGNLLIHLMVLHALARLPRTAPVVHVGVEKVMALQKEDGGIPFILDEDTWCTVTGAVALAVSGAPRTDLARIAGHLVTIQQPAGGWAFSRLVRQTDVDCTSVALEFLQGLGDARLDRTVACGIRSLYAVRGTDGGFPTYVPGGPPEACMTAAAINALGASWGEHDETIRRGLDFIVGEQRDDGSFPPDWSKSRLHGLFRVLLASTRHPHYQPLALRRARERSFHLLKTEQNADGGWGQQAGNASDPISTAYGLIALCGQNDPAPAIRAVEYLLAQSRPDGSVPSIPDSLGPRPFTFRVPLLSDIFALLALGHLADRLTPGVASAAPPKTPGRRLPPTGGAPVLRSRPATPAMPEPDPFGAKVIDAHREELTARLVAWSRELCRCTRPIARHEEVARIASVYAQDCVQRDTTLEEAVLIGKQIVLFFVTDDHSTGQELEDYLRFLEGGRPWGSEVVGFFRSLVDEMQGLGMETAPYHAETIDLVQGILTERSMKRGVVTPEEYFRVRRRTIDVGPYLECWKALRHRRLEGRAATLWDELEMRDLMCDVIALTNDLGSLEKDVSPHTGPSPELSYTNIRHPGDPDVTTRVEWTIDLVNRLIAKMETRLDLLAESAITMSEPRLLDYADFTINFVNGNRSSITRLAGRYPGALERIRRVRVLPKSC